MRNPLPEARSLVVADLEADEGSVEEPLMLNGDGEPDTKRSLLRSIVRRDSGRVARQPDQVGNLPVSREATPLAEVDHARASVPVLTSLPERPRESSGGMLLFFIMVVVPIAAAGYYYFYVASPQYVSEFRYAVTQASSPGLAMSAPGGSSGSSSASGGAMSSVLGSLGIPSMAGAQNYIVTDYLSSRQAVVDMQQRINLREMYDKPTIDWLSRLDDEPKQTEKLVNYWQKMISARYDPVTGLATAEVRAFSPRDAKLVATTLVSLSEALVNRIDMRSKLDSVRFAEADVERAEKRVKSARSAETDFRIANGVIDPTTSVVSGNVQDTATVRASLIQLETQLSTLKRQNNANSPMAKVLQTQIGATREQLDQLEQQVAKGKGHGEDLAGIMKKFEQLDLEKQYAQSLLVSTMSELDQARTAAGQQSLYMTPYVSPGLPDSATYPKKFQSVLIVGLYSFGIWIILTLLYRAIKDKS